MKNFTLKGIITIFIMAVVFGVVAIFVSSSIVSKQKEENAKEMGNKVLLTANHYIMQRFMQNNSSAIEVKFPSNTDLDIKGDLPENGYLRINIQDQVEMKFHYAGYCVSKNFADSKNKVEKLSEKDCLNK